VIASSGKRASRSTRAAFAAATAAAASSTRLEVSRRRSALRAIVGSDLKRERVFTASLTTAHWIPLLAILTIKASIVEMERKFAGVMSDAGIVMPNSASTAIIRLTMSSEVQTGLAELVMDRWRPG